jgi:hypothetical protein
VRPEMKVWRAYALGELPVSQQENIFAGMAYH